jgi:hypothetical protein
MDAKIVYCADEKYRERLEALRKAEEANAELMGKMTGGLGGLPF